MKVLQVVFLFLVLFTSHYKAKVNSKNAVIESIVDIKDFKKLLRTKTNVLVCFTSSIKQSNQLVKVFKEAAEVIKGHGTMVLIDCSGEAKKMCKKLKVAPDPYILKHYKDGDFNKDYDRKETLSSMVNFMRDPTGDIPWEEDSRANYVAHIPDAGSLAKFIKRESKPLMIMFYAPWCGFCKSLKPEYASAAEELQNEAVLAAIDVNRPENAVVRTHYNITGFPTLLYYEQGELKFQYEGDNTKNAIINFMRNPQTPPVKIKEPEWSDVDNEVVHLTSSSFVPVIKEESSVLVMFYAPWCGHCKRMKPEYEKAAAVMKEEGIPGILAAVDATKEQSVASQYSIKGYPTVKYFAYGELKFDVNVREASQIVNFMKNPVEPPMPTPVEVSWSDEKTNVIHLNEENFKTFLKKKKHVIVMFYAPC
ncbi:protein disulfide-isomerase A5 isoform X1 [Agrilus planipennis]|uniref:Protein disulfide-isomerase A5 isoform X1 n=1 Tax=Agrilus planipennis TaxID=224129 RepID=A0A7F5RA19_AGRPL|nr:protein disulfide-isomerase A5 isoform X1 [Agrilus planipennis]